MDSLTLFGHLFKTRCEAICIFLDFFTEKRGSHREIYDFFRKNHEMHCICKRCSIYCNKNCSGNMQILCSFAETTYTPSGDENPLHTEQLLLHPTKQLTPRQGTKTSFVSMSYQQILETTYTPSGDENTAEFADCSIPCETTNTPAGDEKTGEESYQQGGHAETTYTPSGDENFATGFPVRPIMLKQLTPRQGTKTH